MAKQLERLVHLKLFDGCVIKPTLIHGGLWDGNVGTDNKTGPML
ncbi:hypothetical protein G6011_04531, partial [Alternaria panax]